MGGKPLSEEAYKKVADEAKSKGSASHAGEQRKKEGKGLHEYIDPKAGGVIRRSISWLEPRPDGSFYLLRGTAMLEETRFDTTSSMGNNVDIAMECLPKTHNLLAKIPGAVLRRYDVQMITSIFGDVCDDYILCRSQAEFDHRIAEQMTYMVPEKAGGDWPEDPQYGLFGAAYLTWATIKELGLKSYDFTITDADGRDYVDHKNLVRVFGPEVYEKTKENGWEIDKNHLPSTKEIVNDLLKTTHAFVLLVGTDALDFWQRIYGRERVIVIPETRLLPEIKATIIGLTEGVLGLTDVVDFLKNTGLSESRARDILKAVKGIPIGAQTMLPNFDKVPLKGDIFAQKGDLWPTAKATEEDSDEEEKDIWK